MTRALAIAGLGMALALAGGATAHADGLRTDVSYPKSVSLSLAPSTDGSLTTAKNSRKTVTIDTGRHWGLKVELAEPTRREQDWRDVEAGAYYRVSPRLRIGGSVGLTTGQPENAPQSDKDTQAKASPRVRLETNLKF